MNAPISRTHYFNGEFLNASDFQTEQNYNISKLEWLNRSLFTYGVAHGLRVDNLSDQRLISVSEGMAIDKEGREIIRMRFAAGVGLLGRHVPVRGSDQCVACC